MNTTGDQAGIEAFKPQRILSYNNRLDLLEWGDRCIAIHRLKLLIVLSDVLFMDSAGLGALITLQKRVLAAGGKLMLCGIQGQAQMLLELSGLDASFPMFESESAAISANCGN